MTTTKSCSGAFKNLALDARGARLSLQSRARPSDAPRHASAGRWRCLAHLERQRDCGLLAGTGAQRVDSRRRATKIKATTDPTAPTAAITTIATATNRIASGSRSTLIRLTTNTRTIKPTYNRIIFDDGMAAVYP